MSQKFLFLPCNTVSEMESWTLEKTHAEAIDRAAFVVVALLVLVLRATLDNGFGWLADAFITMTRMSS